MFDHESLDYHVTPSQIKKEIEILSVSGRLTGIYTLQKLHGCYNQYVRMVVLMVISVAYLFTAWTSPLNRGAKNV